jgi:methylation protein EvaC
MNCKITNKKIKPFMSFGKMPIANGFIEKKDFDTEFFFNMEVGFSEDISLFQLKEHPSPEQMFNNKYPFFTGSSEYMKIHFSKYAKFIMDNYLNNNSKIVEIGSNDGTFLKNFKDSNLDFVGFEPSSNVAQVANSNKIKTLNSFFNQNSIEQINEFKNKTDVVYAANVICHIPNLPDLIKSVDKLLSKNGVFIFEEPYLGSMFEKTSYDQIYDEHIFIFSGSAIHKIFDLFDMELIDLIKQPTHGGSMRYVVARKGSRQKKANVQKILDQEKYTNLDNYNFCEKFKDNCESSKMKLKKLLHRYKNDGKKIAGYAATSKSTTVLNYCEIGNDVIDYICDTTDEKINKYSPGMHIPIVPIDYFRKNMPDIAYLFAWNHKEEIFNKEKEFSLKNNKWISHIDL